MKLVLNAGDVTHIGARPSLRRSLKQSLNRMDAKEHKTFFTALKSGQLDGGESPATLEALSLYGQFQKFKNKGNLDAKEQNLLASALKNLAAKDATASSTPVPTLHNRPDLGHVPSTVGAGVMVRDGVREGWLEGRLGYHELIDPTLGYEPTLHINYLKFRMGFDDRRATWERLDLVDVFTLPPLDSLDPLLSWHASLSLLNKNPIAQEKVLAFRFGAGVTGELLSETLYLYALPTMNVLGLTHQGNYQGLLQPSLLAGLLFDQSPYKLSAQLEKFAKMPGKVRINPDASFRIDQSFSMTREWQMVQSVQWLEVDKVEKSPEVSFGVKRYF